MLKESVVFILRVGIFLVCGYSLYELIQPVFSQLGGNNVCSKIGFVPVCYLKFICYLAMALSVMVNPKKTAWLFYPGWIPVFLLAMSTSSLEILGKTTCGQHTIGISACFVALFIVVVLLIAYWYARGKRFFRL